MTENLLNLSLDELRKAVVNDPRNPQLRHLLGAEMAQNKDYEGAVMEMSAALAFDPLMHVARFQLGLLHITMARPDHAATVLEPLESLDDNAALKHFKRALLALIVDDFATCIDYLKSGIELNKESEPLNKDMQMLLGRVQEALAQSAPKIEPGATPDQKQPAEKDNVVRTDFSLYNQNRH